MPGLTIAGDPRFPSMLNVITYLKINLASPNITTTWTSFIPESARLFWKLEGITPRFSRQNMLLYRLMVCFFP